MRIGIALVTALATAGVAAGCGGDGDGGGDLGLISEGELFVGVDTPFWPFALGQPPDISGYDIDVMNEIGERIGLEVRYQDTAFETVFRDVAQGRFDTAAAASTITNGRERTVDFSDPYYLTDQALLAPEGSDIATVEDLPGATVGAQDATTGETYANDETDAKEVRGFPEGPDAIAALRAGQVDAVIIDLPVAEDAVAKQGGVEIVDELVTRELYGFAFAEDNDALREDVNEAIAEMKEDGTIAELYDKYRKFFKEKEPPAEVIEGTHEPT